MNTKFILKLFLIFGTIILGPRFSMAQLTIQENQTAQALVNMLVGQGVVTSNAVLTCPGTSSGKFSGLSNLGIDSGIILSTGRIKTGPGVVGANGPATLFVSPSQQNLYDADLAAIANYYATNPPANPCNNSCVLEFDFVPKGDTVRFDYVYASEEYNTFACSGFNDPFALLISGPGIVSNFTPLPTKRNVALVPGTNTPILINTINAGNNVNANCTSIDPNAPYTQYFVNNIVLGGTTVTYNGFTTVLTAQANVIPCETYHLKFGISNVADQAYQSGVFLKAGSLYSTAVQTEPISGQGANTDKLHTVRGCKAARIRYKRPGCDSVSAFNFNLQISGNAIAGVDYNPISNIITVPAGTSTTELEVSSPLGPPNFPAGSKYVIINVLHPDSILVGASIVPIIQSDTVYIYDSLYADISTLPTTVCPGTQITIEGHTDPALSFQWSPAMYNTGSLTITPTMQTTRIFTLKVYQPGAPATCQPVYRYYRADVEQFPKISVPTDTLICVADSVAIPVSVYPDSVNYIYQWTPATWLRADNIGTNFFSAPPGVYTYNLHVTTPIADCYSDKTVKITAVAAEQFTNVLPISGTKVDYMDVINFNVSSNFSWYSWYPIDQFVDQFLQNNKAIAKENMVYSVVGTDKFGCKDTANIAIEVIFPNDPVMPNAFTPNGDGLNDVFKIPEGMYNKIHKFEVYDRWGHRMFNTIDPLKGWNGTDERNGKPCDQAVYMYVVTLELPSKEIKTYKGDVTLMR